MRYIPAYTRCVFCGNEQKTQSRKRVKCHRCGKSFRFHSIVKKIPKQLSLWERRRN